MEVKIAGLAVAVLLMIFIEWQAEKNNFHPILPYLAALSISGALVAYTATSIILPGNSLWLDILLVLMGGVLAPFRSYNHHRSMKKRS